jgi:predicted transglutaminase-like cysteine proteinase
MFGRVTACSIAAFLLIAPVASSGEPGAFGAAEAPDATAIDATLGDFARDLNDVVGEERVDSQSEQQGATQSDTPPHDDPPQTKMASLEPNLPTEKPPGAIQAPIATPSLTQPFGLATVPLIYGDALAKWNGVEADIRADKAVLAHCRDKTAPCPRAAQRFLDIVAAGQAQTGRARLGVINRAINLAIRPMSDMQQWGVEDRWSSPLTTLATGLGDCEDYAIAKYVALTEAGVATDDVKLVVVRDPVIGEDHAVVTTRLDKKWIVLDNRWLRMGEDREMERTVPLLAFDGNGVWRFLRDLPPVASTAASPAALHF